MPPPTDDQLTASLRKVLDHRRAASRIRKLTTRPAHLVDFSSNDYLSLSTSSLLRQTFLAELQRHDSFPLGSTGSRLLDGNNIYAEALEKRIAAFHGAEAGLLFNSGFDANAGVFATLPQKDDVILYDELVHASAHEGMRLSRAGSRIAFAHNDVNDLESKLKALVGSDDAVRRGTKNVFVAVESVYSMDGDVAPLKEVVRCVESLLPKGIGQVIVDEAHAVGVLGEWGKGLVCREGLEEKVCLRVVTFGKGLGCSGAIVLSSPLIREYLINYARTLIYTTAMPFPTLASINSAYALLEKGVTAPLQENLFHLISHLHASLKTLTSSITSSVSSLSSSLSPRPLLMPPDSPPPSPIFALQTPHPHSLASYCQNHGFMVRPIVAPTVPKGTERVRVCLHAGNTVKEVDGFVGVVGDWLRSKMEEVGGTSTDDAAIQEKSRSML